MPRHQNSVTSTEPLLKVMDESDPMYGTTADEPEPMPNDWLREEHVRDALRAHEADEAVAQVGGGRNADGDDVRHDTDDATLYDVQHGDQEDHSLHERAFTSIEPEESVVVLGKDISQVSAFGDDEEEAEDQIHVKRAHRGSSLVLVPAQVPLAGQPTNLNSIYASGDDDSEETAIVAAEPSPRRIVVLAVLPVFMGYAVLLSLQEKLRSHLGIDSNTSTAAHTFQSAVSLIFIGDLIFRLMHNVFLTKLRPRQRVVFAYGCMATCLCIISAAFYAFSSRHLALVYVAYFIGGAGIGTFETNFVSCITPLGHTTKQWALLGMPLGYNGISIGAFLLFTAWPTSVALEASTFVFVLAANVVGAVVFLLLVPDVKFEASEDDVFKFIRDIRYHLFEWLPLVWHYLVCMFINMFGVILMTGVVLYIFKGDRVPLWPGPHAPSMDKNTFQAVYNFCSFLGDFTSRRIAYKYLRRPIAPAYLLVMLAVGIGCGVCHVGLLAWPGMFLVMFANGSLYAGTAKHVDDNVPRRFNLVVFSVWLFVGDCGSFVASSVTDYVAALVA